MGVSNSYDPLSRIGSEPDAFEAFYIDHIEIVQRFVARRIADPHLAADVTVEIFLGVVDSAHNYRPDRGPVIAWLYGIARNAVAAELRRRGRELQLARRISGQRLLDPQSLARIEERIDAERESRKLYQALDQLPEADRALLELVSLDGLSIADAARSLGVKPATARVRLHRSRARLNALLRPDEPEPRPAGEASRQEVP